MEAHLLFRLHDAAAGLSRVVLRLHSLDVQVSEIHFRSDLVCLRLADGANEPRVRSVLARCVDVSAVDARLCPCRPASPSVTRRTTYVVSCEPAPYGGPAGRSATGPPGRHGARQNGPHPGHREEHR